MNYTRTQSLPPTLNTRLNEAGDRHISEVRMPIHQNCAKGKKDFQPKSSTDQPTPSVDMPFMTRLERDWEGLQLLSYDPTASSQTVQSSEIVRSFEQLGNIIEMKIADCLVPIEDDDNLQAALNSAENLLRIGTNRGWSPRSSAGCFCFCGHCVAARPKESRQVILERAARERPFKGRPSSIHRILAGYGRNDYQLGGQNAVSRTVDGASRCEYCKVKKIQCIIVDRDNFWRRNQCVACVKRKGKCSLDIAIKKTKRPRRREVLISAMDHTSADSPPSLLEDLVAAANSSPASPNAGAAPG